MADHLFNAELAIGAEPGADMGEHVEEYMAEQLAAGLLGRKTGQGFYRYPDGRVVEETFFASLNGSCVESRRID